MNTDLRINYIMTILCKLQGNNYSENKVEQMSSKLLIAHLVSCAFYRAVCFGQVLQLHDKALEEIHFVVENRND